MTLFRCAWLLAVPLLACGPSSSVEAESDTDGGSGGSAASDSDAGSGSSSDSGASGSGGSTTDTGPLACEELVPEPSGTVTLVLRHVGNAPLFVDQLSCGPTLRVTRSDGSPLAWQQPLCDAPSCESLAGGDCAVACADCAAGVLRVEPGATVEATWAGTVFSEAQAAAACVPDDCDARCFQELAAEPGSYQLQASVLSECPFSDPAACECPAGESVCTLNAFDEFPEVDPIVASASFDYDGSEITVELAVPYE